MVNINKEDYINYGESYIKFSDFSVLSDKEIFNFDILKNNAIIFCKTDYLDYLFSNIRFSNKKYILITHYSDYPIDAIKFSKKPACIKKWYAYCITYDHPILFHIPAGIAPRWIPPSWEIEKTCHEWFTSNAKRLSKTKKDDTTLYCNYTIDQYRPPRENITNILENNGMKYYMPNRRLSCSEYAEDVAKYRFIISPPGNGIDAHRNWETLYLGSIPIVIKHRIYQDYDLPFLQVNDFSEVNYKLLEDYLEYYNNHIFDYEPLKLTYWKNRIKRELQEL